MGVNSIDCRLCAAGEFEDKSRLVDDPGNDDVRILDDRFPLDTVHVLLATRRHIPSLAATPRAAFDTLKASLDDAVDVLAGRASVAFEHGTTARVAAGGCIDHTHIHVVSTERPVTAPMVLESAVVRGSIASWQILENLDEIVHMTASPYVWVRLSSGSILAATVTDRLPSQFWRRWYGEQFGVPWNWRALSAERGDA